MSDLVSGCIRLGGYLFLLEDLHKEYGLTQIQGTAIRTPLIKR